MSAQVIKFYLFGDSICFGQLISCHQTWASSLAQAIESLNNSERQFLVQNAGVNGNSTRQALERLHYDVTGHIPDYALVQFGMNDCNYRKSDYGMPRVSPKAFVANLEEIIEKISLAGAKHCFLNTNHPSLKGAFSYYAKKTYDESNCEYNELIRNAYYSLKSSGMPLTLFDNDLVWRDYLKKEPSVDLQELLQDDGIHLSRKGHLLYEDTIIAKIVETLKQTFAP